MSVIGMQHSEVVAAIKAGGDETKLLVVDAETEEFFKRCNVLPTEEHITGMTYISRVPTLKILQELNVILRLLLLLLKYQDDHNFIELLSSIPL